MSYLERNRDLIEGIARVFGARIARGTTLEMLNSAPGEATLAVFEHRGQRWLGSFVWGMFRPGADSSSHDLQLHSRAETLREWARGGTTTPRRCILPMVMFRQRVTQPGHGDATIGRYATVRMADHRFLPIAGLWQEEAFTGQALVKRTCTVVTVASNPEMELIHHRMPAILKPGEWDFWLNPTERHPSSVLSLLQPWGGGLEVVIAERKKAYKPESADSQSNLFDEI